MEWRLDRARPVVGGDGDVVSGWTFILHRLGILFISLCLGEQRVRGQI